MRNTLPRLVNLPKSQSFFLFGGRGTGKSTLLRQSFHSEECHWIDLLDSFKEAQYSRNPNDFRTEVLGLSHHIQICVVDEIQKQPKLLDEIHRLIETDRVKIKFALTGSSARKLKYGGANLLAGRAVLGSLFPFTPEELGPVLMETYLSSLLSIKFTL
jgi:predicted AAA+ superfamily ATPase